MTSAYVIMSSKLWPKVILRNFGGLSMIGFKIIEGGEGPPSPPPHLPLFKIEPTSRIFTSCAVKVVMNCPY